jgi:glutamine amidotransferase
MSSSITIVDYGLGNIQAFKNIFDSLNVEIIVANAPSQIASADRLVLPGVGAFDWAINRLNQSGLRDALDKAVLYNHVPVLGVCVGMQIMARSSEEGRAAGLGWINAENIHLSHLGSESHPIPHMGWNEVCPRGFDSLFQEEESFFYYFLHSYFMKVDDEKSILATANYAGDITAAITKGNIFGTQFHPEKSHHWGASLLKNFAML